MDTKKKGIIAAVIAAVVVVAVIIAVIVVKGQKSEEPKATTAKEETQVEEESLDGKLRSRLTGEWIDADIAKSRPISIMIENTKECLPQYGLNTAGVIYEAPVEGSYTRLMGIFDDLAGLEKIGNVRSCRPYYAIISAEYEAIYVHFGQSIHGEVLLNTGIVDDLNGLDGTVEPSTFYRTSDRKAPHNSYTSSDGIKKGIEIKGYNTSYSENFAQHFTFATEEENKLKDGEDVGYIKPYYFYNKPYFVYDEETGLYNRFQFGGEEIDANDGKQVAVKNIIFQNVDSSKYEETEYLNIPLNGTGKGKYFTNGKMIDITWKKDSDTAATKYFDADGNEIQLNPGQTWICLIQNAYANKNVYAKSLEDAQ